MDPARQRDRLAMLRRLLGWLVAVSVGFPLIRTVDLFANVATRDTSYAEGSVMLPLVFGTLFLVAAAVAWTQRATVLHQLRHMNPFLVLMLCWCLASMLWSPYPVVTLKRTIQLGGFILIGLVISPALAGRLLALRSILATLSVLLAISFLVILFAPSAIGIDHALGGAWRGIFWHKNVLGMVAGFCFLLWCRELHQGEWSKPLCLAVGIFAMFMLIMAHSATSVIVAMLGLAVYLLLARRYIANIRFALVIGLGLLLSAMFALLFFFAALGRLPTWDELMMPVAALFGKSTDLTGRTDIWRLVLLEASRHPLTGIGYGAFWLGTGSPSQYIIDILNWLPLQAHNGYLDIYNELGIVGLGLLVGLLLLHAWNLFQLLYVDRDIAAIHAAIFIVILITNISESQLFRGFAFQYAWLVYSSIIVSSTLGAARLARRTGRRRVSVT